MTQEKTYTDTLRMQIASSKKYELLTPEQEAECFSNYKTNPKSYELLIASHMRLVISVAKSMISYGVPS